jgi:signal transduction histidine kinase
VQIKRSGQGLKTPKYREIGRGGVAGKELLRTTSGQKLASNFIATIGLFVSLQNTHGEEHMSAQPKMESTAKIPPEINTKLRSLAHDLSNSVETIMQASYLLAQSKLDENAKKWAELIDKASRDCAKINREIRDILRANI